MKTLVVLGGSIFCVCFFRNMDCNKLLPGVYVVQFTSGVHRDCHRIRIIDRSSVQYFINGDSLLGNIEWLYKCILRMEYWQGSETGEIGGPLKEIYSSWGDPCIELLDVSGDTTRFRTTHPGNLHVTVNEGFFIKE